MKDEHFDAFVRCENCRFAAVVWGHQSAHFECRRRSPVSTPVGNFPAVKPAHWCGEFEPGVDLDAVAAEGRPPSHASDEAEQRAVEALGGQELEP